MMKQLLFLAAAVLVLGFATSAGSEDVRYRPPGHSMIPGILEGEFSGDVVTNSLPDIITSSVDLLTPLPNTVEKR